MILVFLLAALGTLTIVAGPPPPTSTPAVPAIVERFLARAEPAIVTYRARRRLEARNERFNKDGWMDVLTTLDVRGFRFEILAEGGSGYVRDKVLRKTLEREAQAWNTGEAEKSALSEANYRFEQVASVDGLLRVGIAPLRKEQFLIRGAIFLTPDAADLVRIEGEPAKRPSFWTRKVHVVRKYGRVATLRVPLEIDATSDVFMAGRSTFSMKYEYEELNGKTVKSDPQ